MFANLIKGQGRKYYELLVLIIWFIFSVLMTWYGTQLLLFIHETGQISSGMEIPMTLPYASVPAGCGLMSLRLLIEMYKIFQPGQEAVQGS
jgi:TRAP-type C4-dicarboxylate transport system permease small subunit